MVSGRHKESSSGWRIPGKEGWINDTLERGYDRNHTTNFSDKTRDFLDRLKNHIPNSINCEY